MARRGDPKYVGRVLSAMVSGKETVTTGCYRVSSPAVGEARALTRVLSLEPRRVHPVGGFYHPAVRRGTRASSE